MSSQDDLHREVRVLGDILGGVITEMGGRSSLQIVEEVRRLTRERRQGDLESGALLTKQIAGLELSEARLLARSFTVFFDLVNLAEDRHRVRILRRRQQDRYPQPRGESVGAAIGKLKDTGFSAEDVQELLDRLSIDLVFTAHPSEAKRRSIRGKLKRMRQVLQQLDRSDLLPNELERLQTALKIELTTLWQTDFLRPWRPTVLQEVARGLTFTPVLWETVPLIFEDLRKALSTHYPGHEFEMRNILRFGSWMGGDRDGNPNVTHDVTAQTLELLRNTALQQHLSQCRKVYDSLSISDREIKVEAGLVDAIDSACERWPGVKARLETVSPHEQYRRWLAVIEWRLEQTLSTPAMEELPDGAYGKPAELREAVQLICKSLEARHGELLTEGDLQHWIDLIEVFGFHLTRLDIRQDSRRYAEVMTEIFAKLGLAENFLELPEAERVEVLTKSMGCAEPLLETELSPLANETLRLFALLRKATEQRGNEVLGGHVVSLTHQASDVLTVLWLWKWALASPDCGDPLESTALKIIPLFETIDDLQRAHAILAAMFEHPAYGPYLAKQGMQQTIMVGYSDSTKDGGYLAACWWLYRAQGELCDMAEKSGVRLTFFHGRGGSLGRGGGPAARGILSLPPKALGGSLRLTEQGEVLAERYDDSQIAHRHLEQVTWATMLASALPPAGVTPEWRSLTDRLASRSFEVYRVLVDQPGFIEYFSQATPIDEIENLPIGSRPSRRRGERQLSDLRAIPWVFSWTQNRCMVPAWYGLGTALEEIVTTPEDAATLHEMYEKWPFFQATIDNAILALAKADMYIAEHYASLVQDEELRDRILKLIRDEHERSRREILKIVGGTDLLSKVPWLQQSIEFRNPYIDPLNLIQIELFRRVRNSQVEPDSDMALRLRDLLKLTVQGIAAGMRTTG